MVATIGEIAFIFTYIGFLVLLVFWITTIPPQIVLGEEILSGVDQTVIDRLSEPISFEFNILTIFENIFNVVFKLFIFITISSDIQFLAIFLSIITAVLTFILITVLIDLIPF